MHITTNALDHHGIVCEIFDELEIELKVNSFPLNLKRICFQEQTLPGLMEVKIAAFDRTF